MSNSREALYRLAYERHKGGETLGDAAVAVGVSRSALVRWLTQTRGPINRRKKTDSPEFQNKFIGLAMRGAGLDEVRGALNIDWAAASRLAVILGVEDQFNWGFPKFDVQYAARIFQSDPMQNYEMIAAIMSQRHGYRISREAISARFEAIGIRSRPGWRKGKERQENPSTEDLEVRKETLRQIAEYDRRRAMLGGVPWTW
jgi:hypothetical protein